jgi:hypothetical protein
VRNWRKLISATTLNAAETKKNIELRKSHPRRPQQKAEQAENIGNGDCSQLGGKIGRPSQLPNFSIHSALIYPMFQSMFNVPPINVPPTKIPSSVIQANGGWRHSRQHWLLFVVLLSHPFGAQPQSANFLMRLPRRSQEAPGSRKMDAGPDHYSSYSHPWMTGNCNE